MLFPKSRSVPASIPPPPREVGTIFAPIVSLVLACLATGACDSPLLEKREIG
jgi:hypothetical protein